MSSGKLGFPHFGRKSCGGQEEIPPLNEILASSLLRSELVDDHKANLLCAEVVGDAWSEVAEYIAKGWA